ITTFTAIDDNAVTGYLLTETSATPSASDPAWSATPPSTYTFASAGSKTLFAWAKDVSGNVSSSTTSSVTITLAPVAQNTGGGSGLPLQAFALPQLPASGSSI